MATHQDWEEAREQRDQLACRVTRALRRGSIEQAKMLAEDFASFDDEMTRIAKELDG